MKALISVPKGVTFDTFFPPENVKLAESLGEIIWHTGEGRMTEEELIEKIEDCDTYVALWGSPCLTARVLENAPRLKLMTVLGSTVTPFVSEAMWDRGIRVISGFDYFSESTAEGAIAYILAALRRIPFYSERLKRSGEWSSVSDFTDGLIHKTVGIVSYGGVGRHIVRMLSSFNVKLKVYDIRELPEEDKEKYGFTQCTIEELFSTCDVISIHTPYNESTHHMVNHRLMSMIKKGALLVNTARGGVIDQEALTRHLQAGDFSAALDVYEVEPIDPSDPILKLDNVLPLPHQGGVTTNLRRTLTADLLRESAAFIDCSAPLKNEISKSYARGMSFS